MAHNFRFWRLEEDQHLRLSTPSLPEQRSGRLFLALFFEAATRAFCRGLGTRAFAAANSLVHWVTR